MLNASPIFMLISLMTALVISACGILPSPPTATPPREISAPTLAASQTVQIRNSDELYGDNIRGGQNNATAAALPNSGVLPPLLSGTREASGAETVQIVLEDGEVLLADLYERRGINGARVPGILILGQDRLAWGALPAELYRAGFTVLVVELPESPQINDMDTLLISFSENGAVDPARLAVIGAQESANFGMLGCVQYLICDALVMLSPQSGNTLVNVLPNFNPRPLFIAAARTDAPAYDAAQQLSLRFSDESVFTEFEQGQGTQLLSINRTLAEDIATWLQTIFSTADDAAGDTDESS